MELFFANNAGYASLKFLNFLVHVFVIFYESFLNTLKKFLVAFDSLHDSLLRFFKLSKEFAKVGS